MVLFLECVMVCLLFTIVIVPSLVKNPIGALYDYPEKIQARVKSMKEYEDKELPGNQAKWSKKIVAVVVVVALACLLLYYGNGVRTFQQGFLESYIIWLSIAWFDAIFMDCIWFCHSKKVRIPGTEDMIEEYHNYWYHIKASIKGSLIGIPVCLLIGCILGLIG